MVTGDGHDALAQGWFSVRRVHDGVTIIGEPLHAEDVKSFLVEGRDRALLIDTGTGVGDIGALVRGLTALPITVLTSHAHWDHVGGNRHFSEVLAPEGARAAMAEGWDDERMARALAPDELRGPLPPGTDPARAGIPPQPPTGTVADGDRIDLGGRTLDVIAAPGHCPELVVLLDRAAGILFGTDAAYADALYAQMPQSDPVVYLATLERLAALIPELRVVYGSHGPVAFDPLLLGMMREAMAAVLAGRRPDRAATGGLRHEFGPFSIVVADPDAGPG
jgi:glyoxylase-like metal-dependent hydrolase (beta-lactamase superfamily II)